MIALISVGAFLVAAAAVVQLSALGSARTELIDTASRLGVAHPALVRAVRRADDADRARVFVARTLLYDALQPDAGGAEDETAGALRLQRLSAADRLARQVLAERPASWQAATIAGAATYLSWSLARDPRLLQEYRHWEDPLSLALRLAPGQLEPTRYLATAYLELWPALSESKHRLARHLVAGAFTDPRTFDRLIEPWIEIAGTGADALEPVPDAPWAWKRVRVAMSRRGDWDGYCRSWRQERRALRNEITGRLRAADLDLAAGQLLAARQELLSVATEAPPDRAFAALVDRAVRTAPYGPVRQEEGKPMVAWLEWSQKLGLDGETPLSRGAISRLASAVASVVAPEDPESAAVAWGYLVSGRLDRAESREDRATALWSEPWGPYLIAKADRLMERGDLSGATAALDQVHADWHGHPAYLEARLALAGTSGDGGAAADARAALDAEKAVRWPELAWSIHDATARLDLLAGKPAPGLSVGFSKVPPGGAAVEVSWDGAALGCFAVTPATSLALPQDVTPGAHLLEVETLAAASGDRAWPGRVTLRPTSSKPAPHPPRSR